MAVALPLQEMTVDEKLEAMEALWADLSRVPVQFESPAWHQAVLAERETAGPQRFSAVD